MISKVPSRFQIYKFNASLCLHMFISRRMGVFWTWTMRGFKDLGLVEGWLFLRWTVTPLFCTTNMEFIHCWRLITGICLISGIVICFLSSQAIVRNSHPMGRKGKYFGAMRAFQLIQVFLAKHERNEKSCIFELYNIDWIFSEEKLMYKTNRSHPIAEQNYFALPKGLLLITYSIS